MKQIIVTNVHQIDEQVDYRTIAKRVILNGNDIMDASDGCHTFTELYEHRIVLFIAFCKLYHSEIEGSERKVWRSRVKPEGASFEGWFILGLGKETGKQVSYHLPLSKWEETNFAETLEKAPEWDGHTSADVLERLKNIY